MTRHEEPPLPGMPRPLTPPPADGGQRVRRSAPELHPTSDDVRRFERKIVKSPTCWFWVGAISTPDGYGRFTFQSGSVQRTMLAHRFALLVSGVDMGDDAVAEHGCNEPLCVRVDPAHVHRSTQSDNLRFAVSRGRHIGNRPAVHSTYRAQRSRKIRDALIDGWDEAAFARAVGLDAEDQDRLF